MTTADLLREIRERLERATPGPYRQGGEEERADTVMLADGYWWSPGHYPRYLEKERGPDYAVKDAAFIAAAPTDIRRLLDLVERQQRENDKLRSHGTAGTTGQYYALGAGGASASSADLERMLKLKTDDWLEACKEVDDLRRQVEAQQREIGELREAEKAALDLVTAEGIKNAELRRQLQDAEVRGMTTALNRVESIVAEFGDDPGRCLSILSEYTGESLHAAAKRSGRAEG